MVYIEFLSDHNRTSVNALPSTICIRGTDIVQLSSHMLMHDTSVNGSILRIPRETVLAVMLESEKLSMCSHELSYVFSSSYEPHTSFTEYLKGSGMENDDDNSYSHDWVNSSPVFMPLGDINWPLGNEIDADASQPLCSSSSDNSPPSTSVEIEISQKCEDLIRKVDSLFSTRGTAVEEDIRNI